MPLLTNGSSGPAIRRAVSGDEVQLAELWLKLMNEHHEFDSTLPALPAGTRGHNEHARALLQGRTWRVWVAEAPAATNLLGFVSGSTQVPSPFAFTGREAWIADLYVAKEWRRRGVAGALVRALLDDLSLKPGDPVQVCAADRNDASVGFWRAQGFNTVLHLMQMQWRGSELQRR